MTVTIVDAARPVTGGAETHSDLDVAPCLVTGGVDTHLDLNVAAALDPIGGLLGVAEFRTTSAGHRELLGWLSGFGPVIRAGVEGTGSYGAGLARFLRTAGVEVVEVDRPQPAGPPALWQVRPAGRDRSGPGGAVWPGPRSGQVPGRERRGDPGAGSGQAVGPLGQDPGPEPDPPSGLHRA